MNQMDADKIVADTTTWLNNIIATYGTVFRAPKFESFMVYARYYDLQVTELVKAGCNMLTFNELHLKVIVDHSMNNCSRDVKDIVIALASKEGCEGIISLSNFGAYIDFKSHYINVDSAGVLTRTDRPPTAAEV